MTMEEINAKRLPSRWGLASKPCNSDLQFSDETPATNRHARLWMSEVCEQYSASVTCKADSAALCSSCDHNINPLAGRHCVSAFIVPDDILPPPSTAASGFILDPFSDFGYPNSFAFLKQEVPDGQIYAADSVVPTQMTNNNNLNSYARDNCFAVEFSAQCIGQSVSSSEVVVPDGNSNWMSEESNNLPSDGGFAASVQPLPLSGIDRAARVMRYREKKKNRNFEKTIRYASRKAYAEMRPRIKGRFVKRIGSDGNTDCEVDLMFTSGIQEFTADHGVVPLL